MLAITFGAQLVPGRVTGDFALVGAAVEPGAGARGGMPFRTRPGVCFAILTSNRGESDDDLQFFGIVADNPL